MVVGTNTIPVKDIVDCVEDLDVMEGASKEVVDQSLIKENKRYKQPEWWSVFMGFGEYPRGVDG